MRVSTFLVDPFSRLLLATTTRVSGVVAFLIGVFFPLFAVAQWQPLNKDGVHDPKSPAVRQLQQPAEALSKLTRDTTGNQVRWVQSLDKKEINPREKIFPKTEIRKLDQDIILNKNGSMPAVRFPHRAHTEWLDCSNCHEHPFKSKTGATKISMYLILQGEQCGMCHGAVAFPLTECMRCHSIPKESRGAVEAQPAVTGFPGVPVIPQRR